MKKSENKRMNNIIIAAIGFVAVVTFVLVGGNYANFDKLPETKKEQAKIENKTDIEQLKSSKYTGDKFDELSIGQSKDEVDKLLGKGEKVGITESGKEVYNYKEDKKATYQLYFADDKLKEVGVILNN